MNAAGRENCANVSCNKWTRIKTRSESLRNPDALTRQAPVTVDTRHTVKIITFFAGSCLSMFF
jgi:hypothetical protein